MTYLINKLEKNIQDYKVMLELINDFQQSIFNEIDELQHEIVILSRNPNDTSSVYDAFASNHIASTKAKLMCYKLKLISLKALIKEINDIGTMVKINHDFSEQFIKDNV